MAQAAVRFPSAPPVEPASFDHLRPRHKYIAITLDDGYGFDTKTLRLLQEYDARCTTFLLGSWVENNPKSVRKIRAAGFEIANHAWDHKILTGLSDSEIRRQLERAQREITDVTGNQAPYLRPPGGATDTRVKAIAAELGFKVVMWNRTFGDTARQPSVSQSHRLVMERDGGVKPGDIILCHWGKPTTYETLKVVLPELKAQGFEFVTISELLADSKKSN